MTVLFCDIDGVLLPGGLAPDDVAHQQAIKKKRPVDRVKTLINPDLLQEIKARVKNDPGFKLVLLTHQNYGKQQAKGDTYTRQQIKKKVNCLSFS